MYPIGDFDEVTTVQTVLKTIALPWLAVTASETLLDTFDDRRAQTLYHNLGLIPSLKKIVSQTILTIF